VKVLIITVGGSDAPIVSCIKNYRPDRVVFLWKPVWEKWRNRIKSVLAKRNYSFLAHGMEPLAQGDYLEMKDAVWGFILECDQAIKIKNGLSKFAQLPREV